MCICEHFNKDRAEIYLSKSVFKLVSSGYIAKNKFYETELLPYQSISRSSVLGTPNANHGKLELYISDEIILTFYIPIYSDAVKLCRMITEQR